MSATTALKTKKSTKKTVPAGNPKKNSSALGSAIVLQSKGCLFIEDFEPLGDSTAETPMHVCVMINIKSMDEADTIILRTMCSSTSTSEVSSIDYNAAANGLPQSIVISLNEKSVEERLQVVSSQVSISGITNGDIEVEIKKGGKRVGRQKHTIVYSSIKHP